MAAPIVPFLISAALATAASVVAQKLARDKRPKVLRDNSPTTLTAPGSWLPLVIGRRRIGPYFGWAGNRISTSDGEGSTDTRVWKEDGWHVLCVGPADVIHGIYIDNRNLLPEPITPATHPSGSTIDLPTGQGGARIYWGEDDQPIDDELAEDLGVASQWPRVCHIRYGRRPLGPTSSRCVWPPYEYDITCGGTVEVLANSVRDVEQQTDVKANDGINPAHALWQLLTAPWPHGRGLPSTLFDAGAVEALGELLADEHLPCNLVVTDGTGVDEVVDSFMRDFGFLLTQDPDRLVIVPVRDVAQLAAALTDAVVIGPAAERTRIAGNDSADQLAFTFADRRRGFDENTLSLRNDAQARRRRATAVQQQPIENVTDRYTALQVGARRSLERLGTTEIDGGVLLRGAAQLLPGQVYLDTDGRRLRVTKATQSITSSGSKIAAVLDQYSFAGPPLTASLEDDAATIDGSVAPDVAVLAMYNQQGRIWTFRIRASQGVAGAWLWFRVADDAPYVRLDSRQNRPSCGGTLNAPLSDSPAIIDQGPSITAYPNNDMNEVPIDLTGDSGAQQNGAQLLCCEGELMSLRKVTSVSGGWRLDGIRRGMMGTEVAEHPIGATVFIIQQQHLLDAQLPNGTSWSPAVRLKTQPFGAGTLVDLADVESVPILVP